MNPLIASDRVLLLLSLVPYLREHGPTPLPELALTFDVDETLLRKLISFLGTAGIPGETLAYQHNDLFDIDWDAFETQDIVSLTHTVAIDDTPRFTGVETSALLAGLHALGPLLSAEDAQLARSLAQRLGAAMGQREVPAVAIDDAAPDTTLAVLIAAIEHQTAVRFEYRDARGHTSARIVHPTSLIEREGVWYLRGHSVERDAERTFRVSQLSQLEQASDVDPPQRASTEPVREHHEIRATVPVRLLPAIRGFAPELMRDSTVPAGYARVRIQAWHTGAAVRLAQHGPGSIEIVSPPAARAAVSDWAERALEAYADEESRHGKTPDQTR